MANRSTFSSTCFELKRIGVVCKQCIVELDFKWLRNTIYISGIVVEKDNVICVCVLDCNYRDI